jgi:1-deoxy-D-xylulose-5-phosphate reductoisomerase
MPIDSEHGAIYQCLIGEEAREVSRLWVTASGGPFRGKKREDLTGITAEQALAHPTWNMGPKITIDSSTLMNKGLEVIEAHHLFNMPYERISVVVQPQSAIHSMVEFTDGSVKAHLGTTDMRIPIQYALSYPERWDAPVAPLDFTQLGHLDFAAPDTETFRCLALARAAGERGGTLPCVMNAANEVAVAAFLAGEGTYLGIAECVEAVMDAHDVQVAESIEQLLEIDAWARLTARKNIR